MRTRIAAAAATGLATGLAALLAAPTPAQAQPHRAPHHAADSIRYASVKSCAGKDGERRPCGRWRLVMHSGKLSVLRDAQVVALDAKGKPAGPAAAPIAVSGDGQRVAYFTTSGRLAVRTLGGGVVLMAEGALPRVAQYAVGLRLSGDGARLAVMVGAEKPAATRVFDTSTGERIGDVPGAETFAGFSADGDEVLTTADGDEAVTDLAVYSERGERLARATPPQVVASNGPQALAADGHTVANVIRKTRPELVTYDVRSDQVTARTRVKLPAGDVEMIDWTGDTQVTLHLVRYPGRSTRMTIVQIDTGTGAVKVRDAYTVLKDTYVFAACGG
ncbi:hypothetical protein AB0L05_40840 [Nonomuraea pusilla]|uniref:hypothetical protein n=1 Tax=Nonomuraea pusilla TaxID=46177 RepID=UPI00332976CB